MDNIIADPKLSKAGLQRMDWAWQYMPLLQGIKQRFEEEKPFENLTIAISIHLEAKTANLARVLRAGGAEVWCTGCNPLSTQDEIAAALDADGFAVFAVRGVDMQQYQHQIECALSCKPDLILDDGGDLLATLSGPRQDLAINVMAGTEETTTGVMRMRQMEHENRLPFAMVAVNDARTKHLFDNRYGTGQSVWDGIMRSTNLLIAGKCVVVAGYGWCARGIATRANGLGARVVITEIDPVCALEAAMDGYEVMPMDNAASIGDIFVTATGCDDIIVKRHFERMKDGVLLANAGHFDVEINKNDLAALTKRTIEQRKDVVGYQMEDDRILNLMAEGRLVNLASGDGHPIEIMDMSFAVQALCLEYLAKSGKTLENHVYAVPREIDDAVALQKVQSLGMDIDVLSAEQLQYLGR